jgi:hypothetical protein
MEHCVRRFRWESHSAILSSLISSRTTLAVLVLMVVVVALIIFITRPGKGKGKGSFCVKQRRSRS